MWTGAVDAHKWYVNWIVRRGVEGLAKGEVDGGGNATAILATELSLAAKWEMGPIDCQNITIQIEGTSRDWCSVDKLILLNVTLNNVQPVDLLPTTRGATCFFKGFTVTDTMATG
ncbi:predicted protein [Sclerotinia sclerotiorum 1980 UF-70]|uniref:Uncharacterized protein n=2 Tax=Sclerotinia sclerotiorum (strain ATCC 18683 / 1980 / Ss-1) TaxID=665079 RepID=A7F5W8_SCLS1|nr:predicted protein [Sclerotinia sclerotiorum 1980 UF-70]APA07416.1 hypothetical protein sscle_02g021860 [Sclerotinia sclerotiorum 1980 UF-70]EDN98139.1 predicted protein [Sclerotinia sclerotiorum 1980 UF-70]